MKLRTIKAPVVVSESPSGRFDATSTPSEQLHKPAPLPPTGAGNVTDFDPAQAGAVAASKAAPTGPARLTGLDQPFAAQVAGMRKLEPEESNRIAEARFKELGARVVGTDGDVKRLEARLAAAARSPVRDTELDEVMRLGSGTNRFDAFVDDTGRTVLAERCGVLPASVTPPDPLYSTALATELFVAGARPRAAEYVRALAQGMPPSAVEVLRASGVVFDVLEKGSLSAEAVRQVGPGLASRMASVVADPGDGTGAHGQFQPGLVTLHPAPGSMGEHKATVLIHEASHALDFALGHDGSDLSAEPEFQALFARTQAGKGLDGAPLSFPTAYGGTTAPELFAECSTIFLRTHILATYSTARVTTRDDLKKANPEVYAFMERLYSTTIPQALAAGKVQTAAVYPQGLKRQIDGLTREPPGRRGGQTWVDLAVKQLEYGSYTRSLAPVKEALKSLDAAQKKNRLLWIIPRVIPKADELEAAIKRAIAWLESGATS